PPPPAPRADLPSVVSDVIPKDAVPKAVPKNADVCALGRKYGGWPKDSPQSTICKNAYGR
ncbi:lipoprotein, partial [Actinobacteria bacterium OK074]